MNIVEVDNIRIHPNTPVRWVLDDGFVFFEGTEAELTVALDYINHIPSAAGLIPLVPPDQFEAVHEVVNRTRIEQGLETEDRVPPNGALERIARLLA